MLRRSTYPLAFLPLLMVLPIACGGSSSSPEAQPHVNQPPTAEITAPAAGTLFRAGQSLGFAGKGTDPEDGLEPDNRLNWSAELLRDGVALTLQPTTQGGSGTVTMPREDLGGNPILRFHLRATDSAGATSDASRDLQPRRAQVTLQTVPPGLTLQLDGAALSTLPFVFTAISGTSRSLAAPSPQFSGGRNFAFQAWSDGSGATHSLTIPDSDAVFTATFEDLGPANDPPVPAITSPASGATYQAGTTVIFLGGATDVQDGAEPDARLSWWAEFHHDSHTHPFVPETPGGSGVAVIPDQGETSDNVFYRFHLRATDADGAAAETTRDLSPQKSHFTLQTVPAGLLVLLDGQPRATPSTITGVVGLQRILGVAAAPQILNGHRWSFLSWSDGGAQNHAFPTPVLDATYSAAFSDLGPENLPPNCILNAPAIVNLGATAALIATASDPDGSIAKVEFYEGADLLGTIASAPFTLPWTPNATGTYSLKAKATDNLGSATTSEAVAVQVINSGPDTQAPTCSFTQPADLLGNLTGTITLKAEATDNVGVAGVTFQLDGLNLGPEVTQAPYQLNFSGIANHASGQHIFRAQARDTSGNLSPWARVTVGFGGNVDVPHGFTRATWVTGLTSATAMAWTPDGRLLVCEQGGALRVVKNGSLLGSPMLTVATAANGERGLLGVAVTSAFPSNSYVYVHYTAASPSPHNRISRFPTMGDTASGPEEILVDLPALSSATNHNGGALHFGPDGALYVAVGENANAPQAQDVNNPKGKILRFNGDGTIPSDNPFFNSNTGLGKAVWAYGLRNPFTFNFQPGTGRMHINDVGQDTYEEVNVGAAGANYGWPASEGPTTDLAFMGPIFYYGHSNAPPNQPQSTGTFLQGDAIIGSTFYPANGGTFPAQYQGNYFFGDYVQQWIARMDLGNGNAVYTFATAPHVLVDLAVGPDGGLYALGRAQITKFQPE